MGGAGYKSFGLAQQRVVIGISVGTQRVLGGVVTLGVGFPLGTRCRILHVIGAFVFEEPGAFYPCHTGVFVHLAVTLPLVFGVETEQVGGLIGKTVQVVRVKRHSEYAAYAATRVEQIGLVIIYENVHIKRLVPAALHIGGVLPFAQDGVGAQRVIGHI